MTRTGIVLAVVSALCLGAAFGFMGGVVFSRVILDDGPHLGMRWGSGSRGFRMGWRGSLGPGGPRGIPSPRVLVPHLMRLLDLTPEQTDAIRGEIERSRGDFSGVRDSLHTRIERHLTPKQRERWRRAVRERNPGHTGGEAFRPHRAEPGLEGDPSK